MNFGNTSNRITFLSCTRMDSIYSPHGETRVLVRGKSPFYLDRTDKHLTRIGLSNCLQVFVLVVLKGDIYTAANGDALSSTSSSSSGGR